MSNPLTLSTAPPEHPAMDYAFLRQEGIRHLERLGGQLWTDFNSHDPGITILEQVCYALTDLAQRINYDLPDLLTGDGYEADDSLYSPAQILTSQPVTLTDFRKVVVDVAGVKNAWVEKVEKQEPPLYFYASDNVLSLRGDDFTAESVYLKGLYRVLVELSELLYIDSMVEQRDAVIKEVTKRLHAQRGLGEDFAEIRRLEPQKIQVQARLEIAAVDEVEAVLLEVYQKLADYISPPLHFSTLSELLAEGQRIDQIFAGPRLEHGFIDSEALKQAQRRTVLRTSDLLHEMMDVPGVKAVRTITVSADNGPTEDWTLTLDPQRTPRLDLTHCVITLERNRLASSLNVDQVIEAYYERLRQSAVGANLEPDQLDLPTPLGRDRHVGNYYSIQHQFPATYGIGVLGLPESATAQRKAQAQQLKAYLLFFDQVLANYFSQLDHAKAMFSFSGNAASAVTYFAQAINDPSLGLEGIRELDPAHQGHLQQLTENPYQTGTNGGQADFSRRNRFLNHLLARFAEQFTDYSLILYGVMPDDDLPASAKLVQDKQNFLQDYPHLSSARGSAFNYLAPHSHDNCAGLEKRLRRKLGIIEAEEAFYLVENILLRPMSADDQQDVPILAAPQRQDPYSLQLSFVFPSDPPRFQNKAFKTFIERTIREETPAHLSLTIHWLGSKAMQTFKAAYQAWLAKRRDYWQDQLGVEA